MSDQEKALQTQLENISEKTGKSLAELFAVIQASGLEKHGKIRDYLKSELDLGYGDANALTHVYRQRDEEELSLAAHVDRLYSDKKEQLRPIHDKFMEGLKAFGEFAISPKKKYLSLRRKKQFAMIGPATNSRVEVGINANDLSGGKRLIENKPGGMSQYKVKLTEAEEVDAELMKWVKQAFDQSG
jgi:t-SNARE complex subunit (syntaxin)